MFQKFMFNQTKVYIHLLNHRALINMRVLGILLTFFLNAHANLEIKQLYYYVCVCIIR